MSDFGFYQTCYDCGRGFLLAGDEAPDNRAMQELCEYCYRETEEVVCQQCGSEGCDLDCIDFMGDLIEENIESQDEEDDRIGNISGDEHLSS